VFSVFWYPDDMIIDVEYAVVGRSYGSDLAFDLVLNRIEMWIFVFHKQSPHSKGDCSLEDVSFVAELPLNFLM
jgi:hypothetical protein